MSDNPKAREVLDRTPCLFCGEPIGLEEFAALEDPKDSAEINRIMDLDPTITVLVFEPTPEQSVALAIAGQYASRRRMVLMHLSCAKLSAAGFLRGGE